MLAGGIAHDFNNALVGIVGNVKLARVCEPDERNELLARSEQAAVGARRLTQQLLTFVKGGKPVQRSANVGKFLGEAVELAGSGSHLRIQVDVPNDRWRARLDSGQFSQVVSNLVINAQQATAEGGGLLVRASNFRGDPATGARQGDERYVRIDFEDNGTGISEDVRDRVFDPYFTTEAGGSGLGLATAYAICNSHGGALTLESREGRIDVQRVLPGRSRRCTKKGPIPIEGAPGRGHDPGARR